jgi:hypothetical protein
MLLVDDETRENGRWGGVGGLGSERTTSVEILTQELPVYESVPWGVDLRRETQCTQLHNA